MWLVCRRRARVFSRVVGGLSQTRERAFMGYGWPDADVRKGIQGMWTGCRKRARGYSWELALHSVHRALWRHLAIVRYASAMLKLNRRAVCEHTLGATHNYCCSIKRLNSISETFNFWRHR